MNMNTDRSTNHHNEKSINDQKSGIHNTAHRNSVKFTTQLVNDIKNNTEVNRQNSKQSDIMRANSN